MVPIADFTGGLIYTGAKAALRVPAEVECPMAKLLYRRKVGDREGTVIGGTEGVYRDYEVCRSSTVWDEVRDVLWTEALIFHV